MKTRKSFLMNPLLLASIGCLMAFAVACGDDDDSSGPTPSGGTKNTAGKSSAAGEGGTGATSGKSSMGGNEPAMGGAGAGPVMPEGGMAGAAGAGCIDAADRGCYSCKPKTLTQFLNACPTTGCEPFDNSKLTSIKAGKLPDLP